MKWAAAAISLLALAACEERLNQDAFQRRAERVYGEANPGFGVARREGPRSVMVRGDQLHVVDTGPLFAEYKESRRSASDWFTGWKERLDQEAKSRRKSLTQARSDVVPVLKGGAWIRVQDLGAIGPKDLQEQIRPWRKEVTEDLYVVLGIPEELLGLRLVSLREIDTSTVPAEEWLARAIGNVVRKTSTATGSAEVRRDDGRLLAIDLPNADGISAVVLDKGFRKNILRQFGVGALGAAVPSRDVLIVFDPDDFVAVKPVRARAHQLYDQRNHPGFRGLLRFDEDKIWILEPAHPKPATLPPPE